MLTALVLGLPACGDPSDGSTSDGGTQPDLVFDPSDEAFVGYLRTNSSGVFVHALDLTKHGSRVVRIDCQTRARSVVAELGQQWSLGDLFVTESDVFFTEREKGCLECFDNTGWIRRVSTAGGEVSTLAELDASAPHRLVAAGGYVWFTDVNRLRRIPVAGGQPETILSSAHDHTLAASDAYVYFQGPSRIDRVPLSGTTASELAPTDASLVTLAVHDGFVYWASGYGLQSDIRRTAEDDGFPSVLATNVGIGALLNFAAGPALFFTDEGKGLCNGQIVRVDLETSQRVVWASELCNALEVATGSDDVFFLARSRADAPSRAILRISAWTPSD